MTSHVVWLVIGVAALTPVLLYILVALWTLWLDRHDPY